MKFETRAIHESTIIDPATGGIGGSLQLSTTFERAEDGSYPGGYVYTRESNPNRLALERGLAVLEGGVDAAAFSSGSGATMTLLQALQSGDHVVVPQDMYYGLRRLMQEVFALAGLRFSYIDMADLNAVEQAVTQDTRLVIIETPSNPLLKITDIQAVGEITHAAGAYLAVDNTILTPVLQRPLELGADFVIHATTKYMGGHSDVLGGALIAREATELWQRIQLVQHLGGSVPSPFDCWLVARGLQTLAYRMRGHNDNAQKVAAFLAEHPAIDAVLYPGLETHAGNAVHSRQSGGGGGLMSVLVKGEAEAAINAAAKVRVFTRATSFGGVHSLIEHRASVEGPDSTTPGNLLRLSIGLEHPDDLIADLDHALGS